MATILAYTVSTLIGKEIVTSAIRETATSAYTMMYTFIDHPEINKVLKELDTKATIETVENIIKNINSDNINKTTHIILNQVHQILCDIIDDLSTIFFIFTLSISFNSNLEFLPVCQSNWISLSKYFLYSFIK